ncbi:TetR/AcrR family transcriptional regulator [Allokutzneria sp. NRRL B-24872]|uniref:TetR/AcrR family transcriptional regulator n=1 Tax=Allokutzneria sp. NRRL B-24872 TaxID=1137961 RepID=UPI000A361718|nr:TetR/AcrR family transcriptional regulator [Allokutzneria sp. NRRL B-24872]
MSTTRSRREQYAQATRAAVLAAAGRRFAERGFAGTALEDVATDVQATRGAIYHHFANKTALFAAAFEELDSEATRASAAAAARAATPWEAALAALEVFLEHCCDPVFGRVVWLEAPIALGSAYWQAAEQDASYRLVEQLVTAMIDSGDIDPQPLRTTTRLLFSMLGAAGIALAQAAPEDKSLVKAEYTAVFTRMVAGLRPRA